MINIEQIDNQMKQLKIDFNQPFTVAGCQGLYMITGDYNLKIKINLQIDFGSLVPNITWVFVDKTEQEYILKQFLNM